jgi:hypothetical protein
MMKQNRSMAKMRGNRTAEKHNAVEVMLTFSTPSPQNTTGMPSRRDHARVLGGHR